MSNESFALSRSMTDALLALADVFERRGIRYALIGGLAAGYRGTMRHTEDIDFILHVPQLSLPGLLDELKAAGFTFDADDVIRRWTREHMAVLRFREVQIDWLKPLLPCYQHIIDSAQSEDWLGSNMRLATAEGLILTKLIAFRPQDVLDIQNILASNRGELDLELIDREWTSVFELSDTRREQFGEWLRDYYQPPRSEANTPSDPG